MAQGRERPAERRFWLWPLRTDVALGAVAVTVDRPERNDAGDHAGACIPRISHIRA